MIEAVGQRQDWRGAANSGSGIAANGTASGRVFEDANALRTRLGAYLSAQAGSAVVVESLTKFSAGVFWITYGVRVSGYPAARGIIPRIWPPYGPFSPHSAMPQIQSLSAPQGRGVPISPA